MGVIPLPSSLSSCLQPSAKRYLLQSLSLKTSEKALLSKYLFLPKRLQTHLLLSYQPISAPKGHPPPLTNGLQLLEYSLNRCPILIASTISLSMAKCITWWPVFKLHVAPWNLTFGKTGCMKCTPTWGSTHGLFNNTQKF